jgi:hypothetical protein
MHGARMPPQLHRVNAARAGVVKWTTGWLSGWSGSKDFHDDVRGPWWARSRRGSTAGRLRCVDVD